MTKTRMGFRVNHEMTKTRMASRVEKSVSPKRTSVDPSKPSITAETCARARVVQCGGIGKWLLHPVAVH